MLSFLVALLHGLPLVTLCRAVGGVLIHGCTSQSTHTMISATRAWDVFIGSIDFQYFYCTCEYSFPYFNFVGPACVLQLPTNLSALYLLRYWGMQTISRLYRCIITIDLRLGEVLWCKTCAIVPLYTRFYSAWLKELGATNLHNSCAIRRSKTLIIKSHNWPPVKDSAYPFNKYGIF